MLEEAVRHTWIMSKDARLQVDTSRFDENYTHFGALRDALLQTEAAFNAKVQNKRMPFLFDFRKLPVENKRVQEGTVYEVAPNNGSTEADFLMRPGL